MAAKNTACVSFDSDPSAPANLQRLVIVAAAAGINLTKPDGTPNTSRVVCYAARTAVESAEEIATLRADVFHERARAVAAEAEILLARSLVAAAKGITPAPTAADRLRAARGTMTRAECAHAAGLNDESSVRNVEARGMALGGRLLAWVVSVEAGR